MRSSSAIKVLIFAPVVIGGLVVSGGCGNESTPPSGTSTSEDIQKVNDRQKLIEEQYKTQKNAPAKP